jgi:hypothetical protein
MVNEGSRRLTLAASAKGATKVRGVRLPADQVERRRRTAREVGLRRNLLPGFNGFNARGWTAEEDELVRPLPPAEAARRTGRSRDAVYTRRGDLGVSRRRRKGHEG